MIETELQHKEIMPFFCRPEESGGLGYRETEPNIVTDDLFIPSQLAEFVKSADPQTWKSLLSNHHGNEQELALALKDTIKKGILESSNVAVWLNAHKTITFEGETVPLYLVSGTELGGDVDFRKNIFAAVEEMPHKVKCDGVTLQNLRPDISFFLNGIFIGYMELKSVTNGQTAGAQGRGKVIGDYLECVKGMAERAKAHPAALANRRETLWMFEKGIHLTTTDVNETYVIRSIGLFFDDAIMVAHNHPSGDPQPGKADIETTQTLLKASKLLSIPLLDHLVLGAVDAAGGKGYVSMRESGIVRF